MNRLARVLLNLGTIGTVAGMSQLHGSVVTASPYAYISSFRFPWSIAYMITLAVAAYGFGLPDLTRARRDIVLASISATASAALGISAVQLMLGVAVLPRFVVFGSAIVLVTWFWICADIAADWRSRQHGWDRVVLLGPPSDPDLEHQLGDRAEVPGTIVCVISSGEATPSASDASPLVRVVEQCEATVLVLDRTAQADPALLPQIAALHERGVRIRTMSLFYEEWLGKLPVDELERVSLMFDIGELHRARYARQRRVVDLALGTLGTAVLVLVTPLVLAGNLVANRGPLLYRQKRIGHHGRPFTIIKFRTMRPAAAMGEVVPTSWTTEDDPRVTPFGRLLRRSHLDELPQVLNILAGDLSVVGPRPEQPHYVEELSQKLPFYQLRHLARPGLTGWAQVKFPYGSSDLDALEKLQYEFYYLRNQGLGLDLRIVGRTLRAVLGGGGR